MAEFDSLSNVSSELIENNANCDKFVHPLMNAWKNK